MATEPNVPSAIQRQVAEAATIQAQLDAITAAAPAVTPFNAIPVTPPAPPAAPAPAPVQPNPPPPAPVAPPAPTPKPEPTMQDFLKSQQAVLDAVLRNNAPPAPAPQRLPEPPAPITVPKSLPPSTAEDKEKFDDSVLNMVRRHVEPHMQATWEAFNKLDQRLQNLERRTTQAVDTAELSVQQLFLQRLSAAVPDYESINTEDGWLSWLAKKDAGYRQPRQNALNEAVAAFDAEAVIGMFQAYKKIKAPAPAPQQQSNALESQVVPDTAAPTPPPPAEQKPRFAESQIKFFYTELAKGRYKGREAEVKSISDAIEQAVAEGRVVTG